MIGAAALTMDTDGPLDLCITYHAAALKSPLAGVDLSGTARSSWS
ncbi:MAG: hypothetical protein V7632_3128 [Bradyrhizobium sp.]